MSKADSWISVTLQTLKKASPTSLKIFLRLVRIQKVIYIMFYVHSEVHFVFICSAVLVHLLWFFFFKMYRNYSSREAEDDYKVLGRLEYLEL